MCCCSSSHTIRNHIDLCTGTHCIVDLFRHCGGNSVAASIVPLVVLRVPVSLLGVIHVDFLDPTQRFAGRSKTLGSHLCPIDVAFSLAIQRTYALPFGTRLFTISDIRIFCVALSTPVLRLLLWTMWPSWAGSHSRVRHYLSRTIFLYRPHQSSVHLAAYADRSIDRTY